MRNSLSLSLSLSSPLPLSLSLSLLGITHPLLSQDHGIRKSIFHNFSLKLKKKMLTGSWKYTKINFSGVAWSIIGPWGDAQVHTHTHTLTHSLTHSLTGTQVYMHTRPRLHASTSVSLNPNSLSLSLTHTHRHRERERERERERLCVCVCECVCVCVCRGAYASIHMCQRACVPACLRACVRLQTKKKKCHDSFLRFPKSCAKCKSRAKSTSSLRVFPQVKIKK